MTHSFARRNPSPAPFLLDEEAGVLEEAGILIKAMSEDLRRRKSMPWKVVLSSFNVPPHGGHKREEAVYEVKGM